MLGIAALGAAGFGLSWSINNVPWVGPWLADTGRELLGPEQVATLEEAYYAVLDEVDVWRYRDAPPAELYEAPPAVTLVAVAAPLPAVPRSFPPHDVVPPIPSIASAQDGHWTAWVAGPGGVDPVLVRTQIHPDKERTHAVVAIIAIDLARVNVHAVAGTKEPANAELPSRQRPGIIPAADRSSLVAAFNGGWQAVHGKYGMRVGELLILPFRNYACTIAMGDDGRLRITGGSELSVEEPRLRWFRQAPPCLVENGVLDKHVENPESRRWGAAIGGATVIRRSAVGIDKAGEILYYAAGDSLSAGTLTLALTAAGATSAAMLDINWSYPKFVVYGPPSVLPDAPTDSPPPLAVESLFQHPLPPPGLYSRSASARDFFYVSLAAPVVSSVDALTATTRPPAP